MIAPIIGRAMLMARDAMVGNLRLEVFGDGRVDLGVDRGLRLKDENRAESCK